MNNKLYNTRSKSRAVSKDLMQAVDEVLQEYTETELELPTFIVAKGNLTENNEAQTVMKSDYVVINEMNADLWDKALTTCLGDITAIYFPHYTVIQKFINHILNSKYLDLGVTKCFFSRLLLFHPPNTFAMQNYYWHILNDKYVTLNNINKEDKNIFWCLIEALMFSLENPECLTENYSQKEFADSKDEILGLANNLNKKKNRKDSMKSGEKSQICFESLSSVDKVQRILIILEFLCNVLDADFRYRLRQNRFLTKKQERCFLSLMLWEDVSSIGVTCPTAKKLINVFKLMEQSALNHTEEVHRKLLILLAEVVRLSDLNNNNYPYFGNNSNGLACDISLKFIEIVVEDYKPENVMPIRMLKPHWLRLLVCSKLLSYVTGQLCYPELAAAHDILKHLVNLNVPRGKYYGLSERGKDLQARKQCKDEDIKNFNAGTNYCYSACSLKHSKKIKRSRPSELDINALDDKGWSALHKAILLGHKGCVEELLNYRPANKKYKALDTRIKGYKNFTPFMCAVMKDEEKICRLLLEHSGPELLEDVNVKGYTSVDICQNKDIANIIMSFGKSKLSSGKYQKLYFTSHNVHLVIDLCIQLVESYLITHRTWEVYKRSKSYVSNSEETDKKTNQMKTTKWDYHRYRTDIQVNIVKLNELLKKLVKLENFKNTLGPLKLMLEHRKYF